MNRGNWLPPVTPDERTKVRLFCFPYAGGGASIYRTWQAQLPRSIEVCAVQLPGREARLREKPFERLQPLIEGAAEVLKPLLDKPFAFFGHSMGALIGYEMARHLRRALGREPVHLFVSGRRAPQLPRTEPQTYDLPEAEFIEELRSLKGTPKEVLEHQELMEVLTPLLRADFAVCQTYSYLPEPPLGCPVTAFGGLQEEEVTREQFAAWAEQTSAAFKLRMFPGDHFFLHTAQPHILEIIAQELLRPRG